jgi:hypothetical protein
MQLVRLKVCLITSRPRIVLPSLSKAFISFVSSPIMTAHGVAQYSD